MARTTFGSLTDAARKFLKRLFKGDTVCQSELNPENSVAVELSQAGVIERNDEAYSWNITRKGNNVMRSVQAAAKTR